MIDVSVIIAAYNAQQHIEQCVRSIMAQTLKSIEIICVNDGSTDGTLGILEQLAQADPRIRVITQKNAGAGAARNKGLDLASGRYLSFLDADDFFEPDMLERAITKAKIDNAQIVVFGANFYNDQAQRFTPCIYSIRTDLLPKDRPFAGTDIEREIFESVVGWAWDKLFEADFIRENGLRFQEQRTTNDMFFVFAAMARAQRITTLECVLAHQRRHAGATLSVTREKSWMCFYHALTALRSQLRSWGLYERFEQDYINYALHFSLWNLNTLRGEAARQLYEKLKESWFEELGIDGYSQRKFYHKSEYAQYYMIKRMIYREKPMRLVGLMQRGIVMIRRKLAGGK